MFQVTQFSCLIFLPVYRVRLKATRILHVNLLLSWFTQSVLTSGSEGIRSVTETQRFMTSAVS